MKRNCPILRSRWLAVGIALFTLLCPFEATTASSNQPSKPPSSWLILDVDNTLYTESLVGIEKQIVRNTHLFCQTHLQLSPAQADDLFRRYGSTIQGLKETVWKDMSPEQLEKELEKFYQEVYAPSAIDMTRLLGRSNAGDPASTGYSTNHLSRRKLRLLLHSIPTKLLLASNSPSWHIQRVLQYMGLCSLSGIEYQFTPDGQTVPAKSSTARDSLYPTKHTPEHYFRVPFSELPFRTDDRVVIVDDSLHNLQRIADTFANDLQRLECIHLVNPDLLSDVLMEVMGLKPVPDETGYQMDAVKYLEAKNKVDRKSIHRETYAKVVEWLRQRTEDLEGKPIKIVDLGAGLLSMLHLFVFGDSDESLPALTLSGSHKKSTVDTSSEDDFDILYTAYESNTELIPACRERLQDWGFELVGEVAGVEWTYEYRPPTKRKSQQDHHSKVRLKLCMRDYDEVPVAGHNSRDRVDLVVGCCFADLLDPDKLVTSLIRNFDLIDHDSETLLYFPITFAGTTQFLPPKPFQVGHEYKRIPSDTLAFQLYGKALENELNHNLDPRRIEKSMRDYGATLIGSGPSNWEIDPSDHSYLYDTMLFFFGTTGGPQLLKEGWDAVGWIERARHGQPTIEVTNRDLLFSIKRAFDKTKSSNGKPKAAEAQSDEVTEDGMVGTDEKHYQEIQFTAPRRVTTIKKEKPSALAPSEVLIKAEFSLISSGTELKIFTGSFDDAALDINIDGMDDQRMAYPLAYGYSHVGRVVAVGSSVPKAEYFGKRVFSFSPHGSYSVADVGAVQIVPDGIEPEDAIFMPSVETALSLVHDAHVRVGENVAVFGQGLIGLLVTAILSLHSKKVAPLGTETHAKGDSLFGTITTFDTIPDRLAASSKMGASQALLPGGSAGPFDVAIEVSGNSRALQAAIDHTSDGGRVVVGSWYGSGDVLLKLGIDFHRSHKNLQTSQVSEIPAHLRGLWTKKRRFALTWELVRHLKPSYLITKKVRFDSVQEAYEALEKGADISIAFDYSL